MRMNLERHYRIDERTAMKMKERSRELNITESEYVRRMILSDLYPLDQTRMKEIVRQISAMGNDINKIASKAASQNLEESDVYLIDGFRTELISLKEVVLQLKKKIEGSDD